LFSRSFTSLSHLFGCRPSPTRKGVDFAGIMQDGFLHA
jgi:hypothetical protein